MRKFLVFLAALVLSAQAFAASYFSDIASDKYGNVQASVSITVKLNGSTATIYSDGSGTVKANPLTTDSSGVFWFYYTQSGTYTFEVNGSVLETKTLIAQGTLTSGAVPLIDSNKAITQPSSGNVFGLSISSAPSSNCNTASYSTAFTCDLSHVALPIGHSISGAATLGQPTTGYHYQDNAYPVYGFLRNTSGWNQSLSGNDGRTAAVFSRVHVYQNGQGDAVAYNATGFLASSCPVGATSFLACPAVGLFGGDAQAGADSTYLNPYETIIKDAGYSVSGIGNVNNLVRTSASRPLGDEWWAGYRVQSQGSVAADSAFSASGPFNIGLDLSFTTLPSSGAGSAPFNCVSCAITMKAGQRILFNVTATDATGESRYPSAFGSEYIRYSSTQTGIVTTVGGVDVLRVASNGFGYATGSGGVVTQATDKTTGVTVNKPSMQITTAASALAGGAKTTFTVTDSAVAATDVPVCAVASGGTANAYRAAVTAVAAGSFNVTVENITGGSLSESPVINCNVIKGASS